MRRRVVELDEGLAPPAKLLRFMPEEYEEEAKYTSAGMTQWLQDRAAWRASSAVPLPGLGSRERAALWRVDVPAWLLEADKDAARPGPPWDDRIDPYR